MAYTFRAQTSAGNASGGALSINKPTGTVDGDLIVVVAYLESDTNTWSSIGSGFTEVASQANTGAFTVKVYYKWASGEGASWTWTPTTNNWRTLVCSSFSGGPGSGTPTDVTGGSQGDSINPVTNQTAPSVTTTATDDLLIFAYGNFSGTNVTTLTGAASTLRVSNGGLTIGSATIATASATGTTAPSAGPGTDTYAALHVAFLASSGGTAYTETGFSVFGLVSNATDTQAGIDTGVSAIGLVSSAGDIGGGIDSGSSILGFVSSGQDAGGFVDTGFAVIGLENSGADIGGGVDSGASVTGWLSNGSDVAGLVDTGAGVIGLVSSGLDVQAEVDSGSSVIGWIASALDVAGLIDAGYSVFNLIASGVDAYNEYDYPSGIAAHVVYVQSEAVKVDQDPVSVQSTPGMVGQSTAKTISRVGKVG